MKITLAHTDAHALRMQGRERQFLSIAISAAATLYANNVLTGHKKRWLVEHSSTASRNSHADTLFSICERANKRANECARKLIQINH